MPRLRCHILIVSRTFPKGHKREGDLTYFAEQIQDKEKIHSLRSDYVKWKLRIDEINAGAAYLSIRYWREKSGKRKQVEILRLGEGEVAIQKCFRRKFDTIDIGGLRFYDKDLCHRDGLDLKDFRDWFSKPTDQAMGLVHFTLFRYQTAMKRKSEQRRRMKKRYNLVCRLREAGININSHERIIHTSIADIKQDTLTHHRTQQLLSLGFALQPNLFNQQD